MYKGGAGTGERASDLGDGSVHASRQRASACVPARPNVVGYRSVESWVATRP